ncbi:MAG: hypothetical protein K9N52_07500 [Verrucomicrobia bacterium]|nr:hypothetical protein [Verrucomicrobiota bacterium]
MTTTLSPNEEANLQQTIEMFEVITQSQPQDYQSLEILREAYYKLGRHEDAINTAKRIAQAYVQLGQFSSAILEYESILQSSPDDPEIHAALEEIESKATSYAAPALEIEEPAEPTPTIKTEPAKRAIPKDVDDGKASMQKLLVENERLLSKNDFDQFWHTPELLDSEPPVLEPFLMTVSDKGILPWDISIKLLSEKTRLPFIPLDKYDIDTQTSRSFPREFCRRWCILPFDKLSKTILVATANPFNKYATGELEETVDFRIQLFLAAPREIYKYVEKLYH